MSKLSFVSKVAGSLAVAAVMSYSASAGAVAVTSTGLVLNGIFPTDGGNLSPILTGNGAFVNYQSFQIVSPASSFISTANWVNVNDGTISGFSTQLYTASNCAGGSCDLGSLVATGSPDGQYGSKLGWVNVTAGYYVLKLSGTGVNGGARASGQISSAVPAPAVLGLVGLGLVGVGFFGSRRRG